jgi:hypothetical protein
MRRVKHKGLAACGNTTSTGIEVNTGFEITVMWVTANNGSGGDVWINLYNSEMANVTPGTNRLEPVGGLALADGETVTFPLEMYVNGVVTVMASAASDGTGASPTAVAVDVAYMSG